MESVKTNEEELTSTMGSLLSTSKDEKNDASDSTPTSSTDAFTTTSTSHIAADDPISSTSSDVLDGKRTDRANDVSQSSSHNVVNASPIMSSLRNISIGDHTSIVSEKDLLDMNITDTSTEKITENVDDIVQDLENLLGEPTTTFDFTITHKDSSRSFTSVSHHKDMSMDLDDFSMEYQMPQEQPEETRVETAKNETNQTANNQIEDVNKVLSEDLKENNFSNCLKNDSANHSEATSAPVHIEDNIETPLNDNKDIESSATKNDDIKHHDQNSECIVSTDNTVETSQNENLEVTDITSTDSKEAGNLPQVEEPPLEQGSNVQTEEVGKHILDENLPVFTNSDTKESRPVEEEKRDNYESSSNFNNARAVDIGENISDEKCENSQLISSQDEKEEKQNEDEVTTNLTSSENEKSEQQEVQKEQRVEKDSTHLSSTHDVKYEVTPAQEHQSLPSNIEQHETAEEKQTEENSSVSINSQEEKQNQKEDVSLLSSSQDVKMEEKGDQETDLSQITVSEKDEAKEEPTQDSTHLISSQQGEVEEKEDDVEEKQDEAEEKQDEAEEKRDEVKYISNLTQEEQVEKIEEPKNDSTHTTTLQLEETEEKRDGAKDSSNLIESQDVQGEEKEKQDLSDSVDPEKMVESEENSSVMVISQDTPTDTQNVESVPLEQLQSGEDLSNLSDVGVVTEPVIESVPSKNEEKVHNEDMEDDNSKATDSVPLIEEGKEPNLSSSQDTEVEKTEILENIVEEPMQIAETEDCKNLLLTQAEGEVTNAESVEIKELTEKEIIPEPELEKAADICESIAHSEEIIEPNEQTETSNLDDTITKSMDDEEVNETTEAGDVVKLALPANEAADLQPAASLAEGVEVCRSSIETEDIEQTTPVEEQVGMNQSMEVQPVVSIETEAVGQSTPVEEAVGISQSVEIQPVVLIETETVKQSIPVEEEVDLNQSMEVQPPIPIETEALGQSTPVEEVAGINQSVEEVPIETEAVKQNTPGEEEVGINHSLEVQPVVPIETEAVGQSTLVEKEVGISQSIDVQPLPPIETGDVEQSTPVDQSMDAQALVPIETGDVEQSTPVEEEVRSSQSVEVQPIVLIEAEAVGQSTLMKEDVEVSQPIEVQLVVPIETQTIEQSTPTEDEVEVSQSVEVQPMVSEIEPVTFTEKYEQNVSTEERPEISSMTRQEDLNVSEAKIPCVNAVILSEIPVDLDTLKGNIVDSVENSTVPLEDVSALDNVLNDNMIISSCISSEPLDIFNGSAVIASAEAAPSTIDDVMEIPSSVSVEGFDMIPPFIDSTANLQDHVGDGDVELPTSSSIDNVKNLEEGVIENSILPLVMEDVPDLEVLNAISSLDDNKEDFMPEIADNLESSDTLLASSSLTNEEQRNIDSVPFEPCIDSSLPTVDEIFAEQSDQQPVDLPDDNLETLLAVASLQGVCETDSAYDMQPVEDLPSYVPEEPPMKIQVDKIESLFENKESFEEITRPPMELDIGNEAVEKVEEVAKTEQPAQTSIEVQNQETKLKEPLVINVDGSEKDKAFSPKIIIKPIKPSEEGEVTSASGEPDEKEGSKGSLKMTITKQSDTMHSILKIYDPDDDSQNQEPEETHQEPTVPKLIIKPIVQPNEQPQSPKMSTRSSKQVFSPTSSGSQRSASPRITIKPIVKPDNLPESAGPVKITIKPVLKPEEGHRQKHSPKLTIKPIVKPEEESSPEVKVHSPRVTIKPIVKPPEEAEPVPSPRITIKPIVKPETASEPVSSTPRVTIKPVVKPADKDKVSESPEQAVEKSSPKITIKPIVKPQEPEGQLEDFEESIKERIVLKINKGNIPGSSKELRKREVPQEEEKSEKLAKIKLKFSKGGGHPHIVQDKSPNKRSSEQAEHDKTKRQKTDTEGLLPGVTITQILPPSHSKLKEMLSSNRSTISDKVVTIEDDDDDVTIIEDLPNKPSPIVISEESNQDSINAADMRDPISDIPVFEITPDSVKTINPQTVTPVVEVPVALPAPRKRGRPRKVPLQVREDFKDPKEEEPKPVVESTRPKRSCRGQSVRTTLGIKPRKPRGGGRGRGSKRGMGTRSTPTPPESPPKAAKEPKLSAAKLKQLREDLIVVTDKTEVKQIEIDDGLHKSPSQSLLAPPQTDNSTTDRADIVMYEEETRMSAETSSRAQTPAKQVVSSIPNVDLIEESQSSVQSTATTESVKVRKGPRLEVHQEPEGAVISADQLAEYYWSGGGPYMLQEQVAQFLGIKSFKRKYPNIPRRVVDMQERDFIRESGLAGEAMCDLGLTAVNSTDILDIMYSDFQDKYEEYCKHQRDRQAKDLTNKQKALSLAASQEKTKLDITQQAVQSAATWNATFNKTRRDQRKACMDLQTLTVHFPKGKMKQINKPKVGHYPVALVPGQFTDYYAEFTPTEINNLPLNTMCYDTITRPGLQEMDCDSQTDGSGSESDSSTSDSDSSFSGSSDGEDCTLCNKPTMKRVAAAQ